MELAGYCRNWIPNFSLQVQPGCIQVCSSDSVYVLLLDREFPCRRLALAVSKIILEKIILTWKVSLELCNRDHHFTGQIILSVCKIWPTLQHLHYACHLQSYGLVESINRVIKTQFGKINWVFKNPWSKAVPSVLLNLRLTPFSKYQLSPFEIVPYRNMKLSLRNCESMILKRYRLY